MTAPTTPSTPSGDEFEAAADLADREMEIADALDDLTADPAVAERMGAQLRGPVVPLAVVGEILAKHNRDRGAWSPDDAAILLLFHGDLVHDLDVLRRLLAMPDEVGILKLLRGGRF